MSTQTRLVLATLAVFNGVLLLALGLVCVLFVNGFGRFALAAAMWLGAGALFVLARRMRDGVEWR